MGKKAENIEPILYGNENHAFFAVSCSVELDFAVVAAAEATAVNPKGHRQLFTTLWRPDIYVQAVLAHIRHKIGITIKLLVIKSHVGDIICGQILDCNIPPLLCRANALP